MLQAKYTQLAEEHATNNASNLTLNATLSRLKLQLENEHTKNSNLERTNDELKRSNVQLQRQIDEWQNLEKREGEEVDTERKRRIALSVELEKLQSQHKSDVEKLEAALEKERQKVQKWKEAVEQWQVCLSNSDNFWFA